MNKELDLYLDISKKEKLQTFLDKYIENFEKNMLTAELLIVGRVVVSDIKIYLSVIFFLKLIIKFFVLIYNF